MLETALADHVELRIRPVGPLRQPRQRRALELGEVLAGQIADEVRSREDRLAVDELQWVPSLTVRRIAMVTQIRDSLPVAASALPMHR
jgi:hypothetical protein